jgi:hypothetical protein
MHARALKKDKYFKGNELTAAVSKLLKVSEAEATKQCAYMMDRGYFQRTKPEGPSLFVADITSYRFLARSSPSIFHTHTHSLKHLAHCSLTIAHFFLCTHSRRTPSLLFFFFFFFFVRLCEC